VIAVTWRAFERQLRAAWPFRSFDQLIARVQYQASVVMIRFFGTHAEYDEIDAETV
jgi:hypothetical protein